jgi:hypothetical protein
MTSKLIYEAARWLRSLEEYSGREWEWTGRGNDITRSVFSCRLRGLELVTARVYLFIEYRQGAWHGSLPEYKVLVPQKTPVLAWIAVRLILKKQGVILKGDGSIKFTKATRRSDQLVTRVESELQESTS